MNNITPSTLARLIFLAITLLNQALTMAGLNPLDIAEEDVYQFVSLGALFIAAIVGFWKNNDFTNAAKKGTSVMKAIKKGLGVSVSFGNNYNDGQSETENLMKKDEKE